MTHTYAILQVSPQTYGEIRQKLDAAGYSDKFHELTETEGHSEVIDLHGLAIQAHDEGIPDLPAMKRAFVAAFPFMQQALTCAWAGPGTAEQLPDAPFLAALRAAWGETR